jgi:hypothetical protein
MGTRGIRLRMREGRQSGPKAAYHCGVNRSIVSGSIM